MLFVPFLLFLLGAGVKADPATDFAAFELFGLRKIFAALLATFFELFSLLDFFVVFFVAFFDLAILLNLRYSALLSRLSVASNNLSAYAKADIFILLSLRFIQNTTRAKFNISLITKS